MKPAPKATKCSMTVRPRAARRVTASAPTRFPSTATSAYTRALDTGQQVRFRVALRVVQHVGEQALQHLAHVGAGPDPCRDQVVTVPREILGGGRIPRRTDRAHDLGEEGGGRSTPGGKNEQVVRLFASLRQPAPPLGGLLGGGFLAPPVPNRPGPL